MDGTRFRTPEGTTVPAVTADEMREVDRVATEELGLSLLSMMENAGRNLAAHARELGGDGVVVVAGAGGNGGGGLACARHLSNRDVPVRVVLDRDPGELEGATATQHRVLDRSGVSVTTRPDSIDGAGLLVDALVGYGLRDALRGRAAHLVEEMGAASVPVLSLDVPSGYDATSGEAPGAAVRPDRTVTLALPKTGLHAPPGDLYLADIGIPPAAYRRLDLAHETPFDREYWVELRR